MIKPAIPLLVASACAFWIGQCATPAVAPRPAPPPAYQEYQQVLEHVPRTGKPGYASFRAVNVPLERALEVLHREAGLSFVSHFKAPWLHVHVQLADADPEAVVNALARSANLTVERRDGYFAFEFDKR